MTETGWRCPYCREDCTKLVIERDELRANVERHERRFRETEVEWVDRSETEIDRLQRENERLKAQIREGNARFSATVDAVVEERLERCQGCGEVSAKTMLCRSCTLAELEDHPNTVALRDLPF